MLFQWWRTSRRRRLCAAPFPDAWAELIDQGVWQFAQLDSEQRVRLHDLTRILLAEKNWEGCGGLELTDEVRVTIAAQAALLLVGRPGPDVFPKVLSILVYPTAFLVPTRTQRADGVVTEDDPHLGQAWYRGPVVLSWADAQAAGLRETPGTNVVLHEFAHQLDMEDGLVNGTPRLDSRQAAARWGAVLADEFRRLQRRAARGAPSLLDHYGATDEGEFFAVATECFFEKPWPLKERHPDLYDVLQSYYGQDPAAWLP